MHFCISFSAAMGPPPPGAFAKHGGEGCLTVSKSRISIVYDVKADGDFTGTIAALLLDLDTWCLCLQPKPRPKTLVDRGTFRHAVLYFLFIFPPPKKQGLILQWGCSSAFIALSIVSLFSLSFLCVCGCMPGINVSSAICCNAIPAESGEDSGERKRLCVANA